jgi:hypothetical protein
MLQPEPGKLRELLRENVGCAKKVPEGVRFTSRGSSYYWTLLPMNTPSGLRQHLILLQYASDSTPPSAAEMQKIMARFSTWMADLYQANRVAATNGLELTGKVLRGSIGETVITDGPFAEGKEVVGGYVLLNPCTLADAVAAAGACPGLDYRMIVEVRPVKVAAA